MSWMDSWSRPNKSSAVPPPFYLTATNEGDVVYCRCCGRVVDSRKAQQASTPSNPIKYCSDRCRHNKPGARDRKIEHIIYLLLEGKSVPSSTTSNDGTSGEPSTTQESASQSTTNAIPSLATTPAKKPKQSTIKGDKRIIVSVDEIEEAVFGSRFDPDKTHGRKRNKAPRVIGGNNGEETWKSIDMESDTASLTDDTVEEDLPLPSSQPPQDQPSSDHVALQKKGAPIRPPQTESEINFSAGGGERSRAEKIEQTDELIQKRKEGQRRAEEREIVRRAARRAVVFGVELPADAVATDDEGGGGGGGGNRGKTGGGGGGGGGKKNKKKGNKGRGGATDEDEGDNKEDEKKQKGKRIRKCEALMHGAVVEPSYAKGNWEIRWRE